MKLTFQKLGNNKNLISLSKIYFSFLFFILINLNLSAQLNFGLTGYYPFNGDANDAGSSGNNGTIVNASLVSDRFNIANSAFAFAPYQYIELNQQMISGPFTVSIWVNTNGTGGTIYSTGVKQGDFGDGCSFEFYNDSTFRFSLYPTVTTGVDILVYKNLSRNKWHHLVSSWDGTTNPGGIKIYADGQLIGQGQSNTNIFNWSTYNFAFGTGYDGAFRFHYSGLLDDARIYNRAISQIEVDSLFHENGWPVSATVNDFDGNEYTSVNIGPQTWLVQNLKTTHYNNGDLIPTTIPATLDISLDGIQPKLQWAYEGNESKVDTFGRLYTWAAANDSRGVCPEGWHIPTNYDWTMLGGFLGGEYSNAGGKLKATGTTTWQSPNTGATNETGFSGLPGGWRLMDGIFDKLGTRAGWWSSYDLSLDGGYFALSYDSETYFFNGYTFSKRGGLSVRCIKDQDPGFSIYTKSIAKITLNSVSTGGEVISEGGDMVIERGVCWNTIPHPTIDNSKTSDSYGFGSFNSTVTGLFPDTTYYLRAYAKNNLGIKYGNEIQFKTNTLNSCQADFVFNVDQVSGETDFTSLSQNASSVYWEFGDGAFSTLQNPSHTFSKAGKYKVCLTIVDTISKCKSVKCSDVIYSPVGVSIITSDFSYLNDAETNNVSFTDNSSINTTTWYWTMGDGKVMKTQNPVYTYAKPGLYNVCLTSFDSISKVSNSVCKQVQVGQLPCNIISGFDYFINPVTRKVDFFNASQGDGTKFFWTFGDGTGSTDENPSKIFKIPGYYKISLSVQNDANKCIDVSTKLIQVGAPDCQANYTFRVDLNSSKVYFSDDSKGSIKFRNWDFGDGSYSTSQNPEHSFKKGGMYQVGLTVIDDANSCVDYTLQTVQSGEVNCSADFISYIDAESSTGYFTNKVLGESTVLFWSFGDGGLSTSNNPVHVFPGEGIYSVGLNTYDFETECMDYKQEYLLIGGLGIDCKSDFSYVSNPSNSEMNFSNRSIGDITGSVWNFGDDSENSTEMNPVHTFEKAGYYNVCLTVVNSDGIPNMNCKWVYVGGNELKNCKADFMYTIDSANLKVNFVDNSFGDIDKYSWNFGDSEEFGSEAKNPEYTYSHTGYFLVHLSAENTVTGCISDEYKLLNVAEPQGLKATFGYKALDQNKKKTGYPVDLVAASSGDGATVEWDFGDKELKKAFTVMESTRKRVTHYYQKPGWYQVCVRISEPSRGISDIYCQMVKTKNAVGIQSVKENMEVMVYPNPLTAQTTISFNLLRSQQIEIAVFDQLGRRVETILKDRKDAGEYTIDWETKGQCSGIYHLKVITEEGISDRQMVISK